MKIILTISILAALALSACGPRGDSPAEEKKNPPSAIVRGKTLTERGELGQSVVALVSQKDQAQALCTGTLIAKDTVLTAAHCVEGSPSELVVVFASKIKNAKLDQIRAADIYTQHPRWKSPSSEGRGDLALVHFKGKIPEGFSPTKLAPPSFKIKAADSVEMLGYGVSNGNRESGSGILRQTSSTILDLVSETEVASDGRKSSVCFGDSGGPAFVKFKEAYVQWGIASSVTNQSCNQAAIHTSVMKYRSWITETSKKLREKSGSGR